MSAPRTPPTDAVRWARLDRLLTRVLDAPPAKRSARLAAIDDPAVRGEVEQLVAYALDEGGFLQPGGGLLPELLHAGESHQEETARGRIFGAYRLIEPIGRGGMGTVYSAERADGRFRRRVAVKVLRLGGPLADRRRFDREQQLLAGLDHPGIARLYDGGVSDEGDPYFVMEYVDGEPIDRYCAERRLDVAGRLRLLAEACEAVEAAHRRLIVHRDLKPSNLLIDRDGRPRLLDFGIAGTVEEGGPVDRSPTGEVGDFATAVPSPTTTLGGGRCLTLTYAGPEQLRGERVTVASDVYQLGLLAYELIAGCRPFDLDLPSPGTSLDEWARRLEVPPPPPSKASALATSGRLARDDLDAVVLKALAFEPDDRYGSVRELRQDLERCLAGRPVAARPSSVAYRLRRWIGRHPWSTGVALGGALLLAALVTFFTWRLAQERDAGREQALRAEESLRFVTDLFRQAGPERGSGPDTTARELLDHGARTVRGQLDDHPLLKAKILSQIGSMYQVLGLWEEGEPLLREGLKLRLEAGSPEVADSRLRLGRSAAARGRLEEASELLEQALEELESPSATAQAVGALGSVRRRQDRLDEAVALHRRALGLYKELGDDQSVLGEIVNLATVERRRGRLDSARRLLEEASSRLTELVGPEHVTVATALANLAVVEARQGAPERALPLFEEAVRAFEKAYGPEHPKVAGATMNLGNALSRLGRHGEARQVLYRALELYAALPGDPRRLGVAWTNLGVAEKRAGRLGEAERCYRRAADLLGQQSGDRELALALYNLGEVVLARGRWTEAQELLEESVERLEAALGEEHLLVSFPVLELGRLHARRGDRRLAGSYFERAADVRLGAEGADPAQVEEAVQAWEAWRRSDGSAPID